MRRDAKFCVSTKISQQEIKCRTDARDRIHVFGNWMISSPYHALGADMKWNFSKMIFVSPAGDAA